MVGRLVKTQNSSVAVDRDQLPGTLPEAIEGVKGRHNLPREGRKEAIQVNNFLNGCERVMNGTAGFGGAKSRAGTCAERRGGD